MAGVSVFILFFSLIFAFFPFPRPSSSQESQPNLLLIFQAVDRDCSGRISAEELQTALSNGTWRPFNAETCRMLIAMFDTDNDGGISLNEFEALWKVSISTFDGGFRHLETQKICRPAILNHLFKNGKIFNFSLSTIGPAFSSATIRTKVEPSIDMSWQLRWHNSVNLHYRKSNNWNFRIPLVGTLLRYVDA